MKPLVIYHGNCADGFGAAWVFNRYGDREYDFHPGVYQSPPPDVEGREVYLVDFSYKRDVVAQMREKATRIVLIDHHKTAIEDLQPLIENRAIESLTSLDHSGAVLAWQWFNGNGMHDTCPQLLKHIEDRDLWRFALNGTREIQANVFSHPYDFQVWDRLMERPVEELIAEGRAIERKHFKDIAELIQVVTRPMKFRAPWLDGPAPADLGFVVVPMANLPYTFTSDAGHELAKGHPFAGGSNGLTPLSTRSGKPDSSASAPPIRSTQRAWPVAVGIRRWPLNWASPRTSATSGNLTRRCAGKPSNSVRLGGLKHERTRRTD